MAGTQRDIPYLEGKFETGDIPTQQDFYDLFASFLHYLQVKQVTGASTSDVMSQKAISDLFTALKDGVPTAGDTLNKLYNLITAMGRPRGGFDASSGNVPSPTGDNEAGDFWRITVAGTIGTMVLKAGDVLIASIDDAAVAADFYAIQGNVDQATDALLGLLQIQNQAGAEDAATNAIVGNIDHTKAITGRGLRWFWDKIKTIAHTFTAAITALDFTATNQSGTGLRFAILDADGKVIRNGNAEWDDTNKTFILRGLNDLSSTYAFELYNLSGDLLMKVSNGQFVEFGGTSAFLTVPSTIIAGNAGIIFRDIEGIQLRFKDDSSNDYLTFEKLSSGEQIVRTRRTRVMDTGVGMAEFEGQVLLRLPNTTAGTHHNILTIAIPSNAALSLDVTRAIAYATNNSYIRATQFTADAKNVAGTVTSDIDAIDHKPLPGTLTGTFNVTISGTNMIVRFQNNDALTIDVWLSYKYTVLTLPTA